jgi:hypothetical protein
VFYPEIDLSWLIVLFPTSQLTGDGNLMTTTEIIEPKTRKFWLKAATAYTGKGDQGGLKPRNEKLNDL